MKDFIKCCFHNEHFLSLFFSSFIFVVIILGVILYFIWRFL